MIQSENGTLKINTKDIFIKYNHIGFESIVKLGG